MNLKDWKSTIIFLIIMFFTILLLMKTDLYYTNPVLSLAGYNTFKVTTKNKSDIIIIINSDLNIDDKIFLKPITQNKIYYAMKVGK